MNRVHVAIVALAVAVPVGAFGAWAFNPDDGWVLHSESLWRVFGIMFEGGAILLLPLVLISAVRDVCTSRHRASRST
jgi:hypothetical protein